MVYRFRRDPDGVHRLYRVTGGSLDGAGDHDRPYSGIQREHFSAWEWARLLVLRGRIQDARLFARRPAERPDAESVS
jgi:hypothetical protein